MNHSLPYLGAAGFGAIIGWYVYYINRYRKGDVQFSDLTTLVVSFALFRSVRVACRCIVEQDDSTAQQISYNSDPVFELRPATRAPGRVAPRDEPEENMRSAQPRAE